MARTYSIDSSDSWFLLLVSCAFSTPLGEQMVRPLIQAFFIFLCVAAPLRETNSLTGGQADQCQPTGASLALRF
jgi:hypothetical protein